MKKICLLGASGSIGKQTLDVMRNNPKDFSLIAFSVGEKVDVIDEILNEFKDVKYICLKNKIDIDKFQKEHSNIKFFSGDDGLDSLIVESNPDMVVNALVGFVGLKPSITALENNKVLALANKETLVVGGEIITSLLKKKKGELIPIDSEHSALTKCLSVDNKNVDKLVITASGGPFKDIPRNELYKVKKEDALNHPTWAMGNKITIDSATMVNKTFEIIEAYYLFGYKYEQIELLFNYESFVHSLVKYKDGSYRLDEGHPDMRVPIKFALYEGVLDFETVYVDKLEDYKNSKLYPFDYERFPIVKIAKKIIDEKGTYGAVFNACNEVAVNAFLKDQISFDKIEDLIYDCVYNHNSIESPSYEDILKVDKEIRDLVNKRIGGHIRC